MFGRLSDKLQDVFKNLRGQGKISESNITDALREIRLSLLDADVHFQVAKDFIAKVKERALGEAVLRSVTPGQQIVKIFHEELCSILGGNASELNLNKPARILIVGLNGAGKTTSSAKLARVLKSQGRSPLLIACDLHRPAAIDQLAVLGEQIDVPVFCPEKGEGDVLKVARQSLDWCNSTGGNVQIFDTAGRQELDEPLIEELKHLRDFLQPQEILIVCDAATGQQAVSVAQRFNETFSYRWERVIDFLKLHYVLSERQDSAYWLDHRSEASVPERLRELLQLWQFRAPYRHDLPRVEEVFPAASYQYVLYGIRCDNPLG
jgi:signal recognition particle subunit SRP54